MVGLAGVLIGVCALVFRYQREVFLTQYLFFLRYPIAFACALTVGAVCAPSISMLGNLFVMPPSGVCVSLALGSALASASLYTFNLVFSLTPERVNLPFFRAALTDRSHRRQDACSAWLDRRHGFIVVGLVAPLASVLVWRCTDPLRGALAAALGVGMAGIARAGANHSVRTIGLMEALVRLVQRAWSWKFGDGAQAAPRDAEPRAPAEHVAPRVQGIVDPGGALKALHARAIVLLAASVLTYAIGYFPLQASSRGDGWLVAFVPALAYLLLLALILVLVLSCLAFYFDKYRVPAALPLLVLTFTSYSACSRDHVFPLSTAAATVGAAADPPCTFPPEKAVGSWLARRPQGKRSTMVLVAASGGGITASLWTAKVLTELSRVDGGLGEEFARSITLISSVSGGGVGAAYFVDNYEKEGTRFLGAAARERVVRAAGASSLNETAFALAYGDLLATFLAPLLGDTTADRGWALERVWSRHMRDKAATLSDWRVDVQAGFRPTQIFNATIAETGERLLLSPVDCPTSTCASDDARWRALSYPDLHAPPGDLAVVTAARLSATFPYVTPLARQPGARGYHIADGGYYDNFGVTTALEWLSRVQARMPLSDRVDKVILLEIRASAATHPEPAENSGWLYATLGPALTLWNVRSTSQRNHNEAAIAALKGLLDQQGQALSFERIAFELDLDSPLSWQLSERERSDILAVWDQSPPILDSRNKLSCLWQTPPDQWVTACGTRKPVDLTAKNAAAQVFEQAHEASERPKATLPSPHAP